MTPTHSALPPLERSLSVGVTHPWKCSKKPALRMFAYPRPGESVCWASRRQAAQRCRLQSRQGLSSSTQPRGLGKNTFPQKYLPFLKVPASRVRPNPVSRTAQVREGTEPLRRPARLRTRRQHVWKAQQWAGTDRWCDGTFPCFGAW